MGAVLVLFLMVAPGQVLPVRIAMGDMADCRTALDLALRLSPMPAAGACRWAVTPAREVLT